MTAQNPTDPNEQPLVDPQENPETSEAAMPTPDEVTAEVNTIESELADIRDKYTRLYAEFDNFRRRTSKERIELIGQASKDTLVSLLPTLDDFERAMASMEKAQDIEAVKEGVALVYNKFLKTLEQKGLKPMDAQGQPFDAELHEAITQIPAPSEDLKGKVVDVVEKGYYLQDKPIRYAKVVIGN